MTDEAWGQRGSWGQDRSLRLGVSRLGGKTGGSEENGVGVDSGVAERDGSKKRGAQSGCRGSFRGEELLGGC